ncbi:DNA repair protein rad2 [Neophaeococcomyces mojaviensis]|uniref:DNA repair protein rad2 n=1 Tax=Neophaeococcomyces mojaviensis TaxID=3383035 RepID=A0ACC2ZVP3_9EURO|nr:DNA repair protein rad2 [Knufia sp. JES_112]
MGVTGLWKVVEPTARPTKLETLHRKRLAVDASIWIYQFLKAVRDKEGNALRNSHVVGFFRRICKLLYFGIKPVFVFDGGAPVLKRETIRKRARRREGRREDAVRTAGKLLAVQVARAAEEEAARQKRERERPVEDEVLPEDQELVYVDEIGMDKKERQAGRSFKKKDQYHLPELEVSLAEMGAPNDPRVMSQAELEEYAMQFHNGEDINLYDFSKIDFDSPFFQSLPPGDKYNILNAARLRSRLRMGYSKEQLDGMFPDRMAFSRFQIERVKERNELTQRLMHVSGMNEGEWDMGGRIAGERGKEYVLVRNDGVEGGWALGVVSNKKGRKKEDAIDLEEDGNETKEETPSEEDEEFEDVAIEGVNRIPQSWKKKRHEAREVDYDISYEEATERIAKKRKAVYDARRRAAEQSAEPATHQDKAQLAAQSATAASDAKTEEGTMFVDQGDDSDEDAVFENVEVRLPTDEEEDDLQKAIAMSLEKPEDEGGFIIDEPEEKALGDEDDNAFDLQAALAEARESKYVSKTNVRKRSPPPKQAKTNFSGPLPFESLNLGQSLLGKKKLKKVEESISGGFDRDAGDAAFKKPNVQPTPDWFNAAPTTDDMQLTEPDKSYDSDDHVTYGSEDKNRREILHKQATKEVINLEDDYDEKPSQHPSPDVYVGDQEDWEMSNDDEEKKRRQEEADRATLEAEEIAEARRKALEEEREKRYVLARQIAAENEEPTMNELAEEVQAKPPPPSKVPDFQPMLKDAEENVLLEVAEEVEWSESDHEDPPEAPAVVPLDTAGTTGQADEDDDLFEDVEVPTSPPRPIFRKATPPPRAQEPPEIDESMFIDDDENEPGQDQNNQVPAPQEEDFLADDSDDELMRQLAIEAEEHDRFASSLNNNNTPKDPDTARHDYEAELKQLRNQQKKDRRDADEVTQTMIAECQALLRLFGLPYITAPMEAEAQCAELVHLGLVDGIVTDDSDIFLFGGTRIYKNMFNAAKFVECYLASDLEKEYALNRRKLIRFAHLLGSDYTEGIPGIGPVTALEIISDFTDLTSFKEWTLKIQLGAQTPSALADQLTTPFRRKFKKTVQKKLFLPTNFPDLRVDQAYLEPEVDSNPEGFQWGVPDLDKLRSFLMATIGWSQERTDEILVPVVRDMNKREAEGVQSNITRFFAGGIGVGGRGINGANERTETSRAVGEEVAEGTAPRNRTGKESGRMKNAYKRLRSEAGKKKNDGLDEIDADYETVKDQNGSEDVTNNHDATNLAEKTYRADNGDSDDENFSSAGEHRKTKRAKKTAPRATTGTRQRHSKKAKI